jgi:hypothetical protein
LGVPQGRRVILGDNGMTLDFHLCLMRRTCKV